MPKCKIAVQNAGCVFAYFCGGHKNNFPLQFRSSFNLSVSYIYYFWIDVKTDKEIWCRLLYLFHKSEPFISTMLPFSHVFQYYICRFHSGLTVVILFMFVVVASRSYFCLDIFLDQRTFRNVCFAFLIPP